MNDPELLNTWKAYNNMIEEAKVLNLQSWALNLQMFAEMRTQKAKSKLKGLARFKIFAIVLGVIWVLFLSLLVYGTGAKNLYFTVSVSMIILFTIIAIAVYIKHVIMINRINYDDSITATQEKLSALQASTINTARVLFLQTPFYCTFWWSSRIVKFDDPRFVLITIPITLAFVILSIWLYRNISLRNVEKKWFKFLFSNIEWTSIVKAKEFMSEIEEYKKDVV